MSRRVKKPLRPAGDRPKGARPYRGSQAERSTQRPGGKAQARYPASAPRAPKPAPFVAEPEKVVIEPPPLPTKVETVVVTADENNMRVDRFLEGRFPGLSFSHIQRIVRKGELRVNGKRADSKDRLEQGQSVRIPINGQIGVIVYVTLTGAVPELTITRTGVAPLDGRMLPTLYVSNTGRAHGRLAGFLSGTDASGRSLEFTPSGLPIMPGETRAIALGVAGDDRAPVEIAYPITIRGNLEWGGRSTPLDARFAP